MVTQRKVRDAEDAWLSHHVMRYNIWHAVNGFLCTSPCHCTGCRGNGVLRRGAESLPNRPCPKSRHSRHEEERSTITISVRANGGVSPMDV